MPAQFVIHTPGPIWQGGQNNEETLLANCYRNCLSLAVQNNVQTIAFPSISTGIYGFPIQKACRIAPKEIQTFLQSSNQITQVLIVCFSSEDYTTYKVAYNEIF